MNNQMNEQELPVEPTDVEISESTSTSDAQAEVVETDFAFMNEQIEKLTVERNQLQDQALRTLADFQNFRKRTQQEAALLRQFATENFVTNLLPVLDNFERTIAHIDSGASIESMTDGIRAVERQLRSVLEAQNVTRIISVGHPFDPTYHEALGTEINAELADDTVVLEIEPGYKMGDKVIRPARVKVSKTA